jgi:hypothetical protein
MISFDIELNGEPYCRAGIDGFGVISVMLHWIDFDGRAVTDDPEHPRSALSLAVSGHRAARDCRWVTSCESASSKPAGPMSRSTHRSSRS